ncbi:hypothetical protein [Thaumasiovibrio sp. DFM-14]|uniref:hypothetical protein n=1 Tax=Thaumasiovibrio sp. DFM-14 TaxID=3384792 RepID=UPI0039A25EAE
MTYQRTIGVWLLIAMLTGCQSDHTEEDESDLTPLESTVTFPTPLTLGYESTQWADIEKIYFDFGHVAIDSPTELSLNIELASPLTQRQTITAELKTQEIALGTEVSQGSQFTMELNHPVYFDAVREGHMTIGLGRMGAAEPLLIKRITARVTGSVPPTDDTLFVDPAYHTLGQPNAELKTYYVSPAMTYRVQLQGETVDSQGYSVQGLGARYFDPSAQVNKVQTVMPHQDAFIHTDGEVSFFYMSEDQPHRGGFTVIIDKANLS